MTGCTAMFCVNVSFKNFNYLSTFLLAEDAHGFTVPVIINFYYKPKTYRAI
jgi:hypothetical protein